MGAATVYDPSIATTTPSPGTVTIRRSDPRRDLARASYELIAELGIDAVTLRGVARRLGATTGLVSHHFSSRAELTEAALDHAARVIVDRVLAIPAGAHPVDVLAAVLPTDAETVENWRFALSVRTAALFDADLRRFDGTIRHLWESHSPDHLAGLVPGDPLQAARHLVALVDGIALQAVLDPDLWPPDRQLVHLRAGFDALTRGVLP